MKPKYQEIIDKYNNDWVNISCHAYLSEEFIKQNLFKLDINPLVKNENISDKLRSMLKVFS